jgi:hypothetical protein
VLGCGFDSNPDPKPSVPKPQSTKSADPKKVPVGANIWLEILPDGTRQVNLSAEVCLTRGPLELLLTRKGHKEHEAILAADIDARKLHEALILAGAQPGEPVRFTPAYQPARGTKIEVEIVFSDQGTSRTVRAQQWVRNLATKRELDASWVFAGSLLVDDPFDPKAPKRYLANEGDVIAIANFESAMLDLPIPSSKAEQELGYEAWEERIPPEGTKVAVLLRPVLAK